MRNAALEAARPQATLDIARDLADMVFATKKKSKSMGQKNDVAVAL